MTITRHRGCLCINGSNGLKPRKSKYKAATLLQDSCKMSTGRCYFKFTPAKAA